MWNPWICSMRISAMVILEYNQLLVCPLTHTDFLSINITCSSGPVFWIERSCWKPSKWELRLVITHLINVDHTFYKTCNTGMKPTMELWLRKPGTVLRPSIESNMCPMLEMLHETSPFSNLQRAWHLDHVDERIPMKGHDTNNPCLVDVNLCLFTHSQRATIK